MIWFGLPGVKLGFGGRSWKGRPCRFLEMAFEKDSRLHPTDSCQGRLRPLQGLVAVRGMWLLSQGVALGFVLAAPSGPCGNRKARLRAFAGSGNLKVGLWAASPVRSRVRASAWLSLQPEGWTLNCILSPLRMPPVQSSRFSVVVPATWRLNS